MNEICKKDSFLDSSLLQYEFFYHFEELKLEIDILKNRGIKDELILSELKKINSNIVDKYDSVKQMFDRFDKYKEVKSNMRHN